jgi:D-ribulokinase
MGQGRGAVQAPPEMWYAWGMISGERLFLGIDVGTGGARAMAVTEDGEVAANASVAFEPKILAPQQGQHEQPPQAWWRAVCLATRRVIDELAGSSRFVHGEVAAVAVDGTSGTLVALDGAGEPLRPALMYNDPRAAEEADAINDVAAEFCQSLGYRFNASFALAKIAWLQSHEPAVFDEAARFVHQTDFIVERLTGEPAVSDYSNALKTGYDLNEEQWPGWIDRHLGVLSRLPRVVAPGSLIGALSHRAAAETGLLQGIAVVSGATDGTAAFLASGARQVGDYNTTLGTTLVFKGISAAICRHPQGIIYCHKLPGGWWLPGAASNVGTDWIGARFPGVDVATMDATAGKRLPIEALVYPLIRSGERFPFLAPQARGFFLSEMCPPADSYAACLQGVAFVERLGYEVLDATSGTSDGAVYSTGGGSHSDVWMQCRADATGRVIHRPQCGESAFGSAVLAAAGTHYNSIVEAVERMVRLERSFVPDPKRVTGYSTMFEWFRGELQKRGYL